jgi:hypothetical protein
MPDTSAQRPPIIKSDSLYGMSSIRILWGLLRPSPFWFGTAMALGALSSLAEGIGIALFIPILGRLQLGITDPTVVLANSDQIDKLGVACAVKGAGPQRDRPARELVRSPR